MKKYERPIMEVTSFGVSSNIMTLKSVEQQNNVTVTDASKYPDIFTQ